MVAQIQPPIQSKPMLKDGVRGAMFEAIVAGLTLSGVLAALSFPLGHATDFLIAALVFLASGLVDSGHFGKKWSTRGLLP